MVTHLDLDQPHFMKLAQDMGQIYQGNWKVKKK